MHPRVKRFKVRAEMMGGGISILPFYFQSFVHRPAASFSALLQPLGSRDIRKIGAPAQKQITLIDQVARQDCTSRTKQPVQLVYMIC